MNSAIKDNRSRKIKLLDFFLKKLCEYVWLKNKIKVLSERSAYAITRYKFSYISEENGECEFIAKITSVYRNAKFVFFDVGAHHGTYTSQVLEGIGENQFDGHLFEPTPTTFENLEYRFAGLKNLQLNNFALSNFNGSANFLVYPDSPTRNGLVGVGKELNFSTNEISCPVVRGDDYCKNNNVQNIHLLKVDAEGHDFFVIEGFEKLISEQLIDVLQFEYTFKHADMRIPLRKYYEFFLRYGYKVGPLRKSGVNFYGDFDPRYNEYNLGPNYVAVKGSLASNFTEFRSTT